MNDLPIGRPAGSGPMPNPSGSDPVRTPYRPDIVPPSSTPLTQRARLDRRPLGLGSVIAFFFGLMVMFVLAAAVAQFAVRGDRQSAGQAPPAPAVSQDQTPAKPSPPADGNPAGSTTQEGVTP